MAKTRFLLALAYLCVTALGAGYAPKNTHQYCFDAIYTSFNALSWPTTSEAHTNSSETAVQAHGQSKRAQGATPKKSPAYCSSLVEVTSLYASSKILCQGEEFSEGIIFWKGLCKSVGSPLMDLTGIKTTATHEYIEKLMVVDPSTTNITKMTSPVVLDKHYYEKAVRYLRTNQTARYVSADYAWGVMGFWGAVLIFGMLSKLLHTICQGRPVAGIKVLHLFRTHVIIPAAIGTVHQRRLFWCTIPKRLDMIIIISFWVLCVTLACVGYHPIEGLSFAGSKSSQICNWMGPRTGLLAYNCLPWLWLFAGRNNIFIWATGWTYRTFSIFHRHTARTAAVLAFVHGVSYTVKYTVYKPGTYTTDLKLRWFRMGIVAIVSFGLLLATSFPGLRARNYEIFLIIHISLAALALASLFSHTSQFGTEYSPYLWPVAAVWAFDRALRLVRLGYCNLHVRLSGKVLTTSSTATYDKDNNVIKIDVCPGSTILKPAPGQYYHIYQPFSLRGWENHPFTLGSFKTPTSATVESSVIENDIEKGTTVVNTRPASTESSSEATVLTFWVRPFDGWTKRLRDQCLKSGGTTHPRLLIEGPYGRGSALHKYDRVVMIAGGTGISASIPYIAEHGQIAARGACKTTNMQLHWATRQSSFLRQLAQEELSEALQWPEFEGFFYNTAVASAEVDEKPESLSEKPEITVQYRVPDIHAIVSDAAEKAMAGKESVVVHVCGPPSMADEARAAVHAALKKGCSRIEYVEDAFAW